MANNQERIGVAKSYASKYLRVSEDIKYLGEGTYAEVYKVGNVALKITDDKHDAIMSHLTTTKDFKHIVKTKKVVKFYSEDEGGYLYIIENELLTEIHKDTRFEALCDLISDLRPTDWFRCEESVNKMLKSGMDTFMQLGKYTDEQIVNMVDFGIQIRQIFKELATTNIGFLDFHRFNVGLSIDDGGRTLKFLDLGHYSSDGYDSFITEIDL